MAYLRAHNNSVGSSFRSSISNCSSDRNSRTSRKSRARLCVFCRKNNELPAFFRSHTLKDENNRTTCPVLLRYVCPYCGKVGDHTINYCPVKKNGLKGRQDDLTDANKKSPIKPREELQDRNVETNNLMVDRLTLTQKLIGLNNEERKEFIRQAALIADLLMIKLGIC